MESTVIIETEQYTLLDSMDTNLIYRETEIELQ